mmetsp:Transcript_20604/g.64820  ORF Transcript_20604/g.64820 Transcript_20604/m.64820 type:complete len:234 (-) Transcript_20604:873-1574(-)
MRVLPLLVLAAVPASARLDLTRGAGTRAAAGAGFTDKQLGLMNWLHHIMKGNRTHVTASDAARDPDAYDFGAPWTVPTHQTGLESVRYQTGFSAYLRRADTSLMNRGGRPRLRRGRSAATRAGATTPRDGSAQTGAPRLRYAAVELAAAHTPAFPGLAAEILRDAFARLVAPTTWSFWDDPGRCGAPFSKFCEGNNMTMCELDPQHPIRNACPDPVKYTGGRRRNLPSRSSSR